MTAQTLHVNIQPENDVIWSAWQLLMSIWGAENHDDTLHCKYSRLTFCTVWQIWLRGEYSTLEWYKLMSLTITDINLISLTLTMISWKGKFWMLHIRRHLVWRWYGGKSTQIQIHKYEYTNTQIQLHKYINKNTQIQIHKYKYSNTNTQIQVHKYKYTNTNGCTTIWMMQLPSPCLTSKPTLCKSTYGCTLSALIQITRQRRM